MAAKPEKTPYFTIDNTGTQFTDLHAYFLSEKGRRELEETARAIASLRLPGSPDPDTATPEPPVAQNQR